MSYDFSKTLIRCSALGIIMTEPKLKSALLSKTCETYLRQLYREKMYGRRKEITTKYMDKGLSVEEDSITLYSRFKHKMYKKNEERINGDFFTGEPDFYEGELIRAATHIYDTKSSWDLFTLPFPDDKLDNDYIYQGQGYMALTGAQEATFAFCLVDTPDSLVQREIDAVRWKTGTPATEKQIERITKNMKFGDIPINERVIEFDVKRDDALIKHMEERVVLCRQYLVSLQSQMTCRK